MQPRDKLRVGTISSRPGCTVTGGNRITSVLGGVTTYYVGNHFEWTGSQRVAMRDNNTLYYLLGDHLGSTAKTYNAATGATTELRYHPYGETRYTSGTTPTSYQFTGQRNDSSIGLYFYNARYYDPALGRFIQADSIVPGAASGSGSSAASLGYDSKTRLTPLTVNLGEFAAQVNDENREVLQFGAFFQWDSKVRQEHNVPMGPANPQALNRYAYCLNNPLRYVDPTGHYSFGNDLIGGEQILDEQGNAVQIDGHNLFRIWFGKEQIYVTDDNAVLLSSFITFAENYEDAVTDGSLAIGAAGFAAVGTIIGLGELAVGLVTAFNVPLLVLGGGTTVLSFAGTLWAIGEVENQLGERIDNYKAAKDVFRQLRDVQYNAVIR